jgi:hypothetical protein
MEYRVVFQVSPHAPDWSWPVFGGVMGVFGLFIALIVMLASPETGPRRRVYPGFALAWFSFMLLWTGAAYTNAVGEATQARRYAAALQQGRYRVVEGKVENFVPMPEAGHAEESFSVRGVKFRYSDYSPTGAFTQTAVHGGPLRSGLRVRLGYLPGPYENLILRVEVAREAGKAARSLSGAAAEGRGIGKK